MVDIAALTTELLLFKHLIATPFIWGSAHFWWKGLPWLFPLAGFCSDAGQHFPGVLGWNTKMLEHLPLVNASVVLLPLQGRGQLAAVLGVAAAEMHASSGFGFTARAGAETFPQPLMGASTFSKLQNRWHLKGTVRSVSTHLPTCGVGQKGSQLNSSRVWACNS